MSYRTRVIILGSFLLLYARPGAGAEGPEKPTFVGVSEGQRRPADR